jgi:hypothetical protein
MVDKNKDLQNVGLYFIKNVAYKGIDLILLSGL